MHTKIYKILRIPRTKTIGASYMSSLFNSILTAEQKHSLLIGYFHCSYHYHHTSTIPYELVNIISTFLDESIEWILSGDELQHFLSADTGEVIAGPSFTMHDIQFTLYLTPNGINESEQGYVQFLASPVFLSTNIYSVTLWYSLRCMQTASEWNNSTIFYYNDSDCASWPVRTLSLEQITAHFLYEPLEFLCYIDILSIEYMDETPSFYSSNNICMNRNAKFQWNIYDELLAEFRYSVCGKYYFKHINVNWMLETAPNGQTDEDEGSVNVLVSLLRLPNRVSGVLVHMVLYCDYNDVTWDLIMKFDYECNQSYGWPEYTLLSSNLLGTTSVTFTVQISILEVYDNMEQTIPYSQWDAYGIIDNTKELEQQFDLDFKRRHKAKLELQQRSLEDAINDRSMQTNGDSPLESQINTTELWVGLWMAASHCFELIPMEHRYVCIIAMCAMSFHLAIL
eukprot:919613_1